MRVRDGGGGEKVYMREESVCEIERQAQTSPIAKYFPSDERHTDEIGFLQRREVI